jgi:hypothetical protein
VDTQHRSHATISGEDLYRRVIEAARSSKRLPAGALLDADNYADFIRAVTNTNGMDDNTAATVRRYLGLAHSAQLMPVQDEDRFRRLFNTPTRPRPFNNPTETDAKILSGPHGPYLYRQLIRHSNAKTAANFLRDLCAKYPKTMEGSLLYVQAYGGMPNNWSTLALKAGGIKVREWAQALIQDTTATRDEIIWTMQKLKDGLFDPSVTDEDRATLAGAIAGAVVRKDGPAHVYSCLHHCGLLDFCLHHFGHLLPRCWVQSPISVAMNQAHSYEWGVWAGFAPVASLYLAEDETAEPSINRGEYSHTFFTAYNAALAAASSTPLIKKRWNYLAINKAPEHLIDMWLKCVTGRIDECYDYFDEHYCIGEPDGLWDESIEPAWDVHYALMYLVCSHVVPPGLYKRLKRDDAVMALLFRYEAVSVAGLNTKDRSRRTTVDEMMKAEGLSEATKRLYVEELECINSEARRTRPQK